MEEVERANKYTNRSLLKQLVAAQKAKREREKKTQNAGKNGEVRSKWIFTSHQGLTGVVAFHSARQSKPEEQTKVKRKRVKKK